MVRAAGTGTPEPSGTAVSRTLLARGEVDPTARARFRLIPIRSCHVPRSLSSGPLAGSVREGPYVIPMLAQRHPAGRGRRAGPARHDMGTGPAGRPAGRVRDIWKRCVRFLTEITRRPPGRFTTIRSTESPGRWPISSAVTVGWQPRPPPAVPGPDGGARSASRRRRSCRTGE